MSVANEDHHECRNDYSISECHIQDDLIVSVNQSNAIARDLSFITYGSEQEYLVPLRERTPVSSLA